MRNKMNVAAILLVFIVTISGTSLAIRTGNADSAGPYLEVKPNSYVTNTLKTFEVAVWLDNITADKRLIGAQFSLTYNSTLLHVQSLAEASFLAEFNQSSVQPSTFFTGQFDNTNGNLTVGIVILPNQDGLWTNFPVGSGPIATIVFQGVYPTDGLYIKYSCALHLENIMFVDDHATPISYLPPVDGYYEITRTLIGDIDGDKDVDIRDIAMAAQAFGEYGPTGPYFQFPGLPASPRWEPVGPLADLNNDNQVTMQDIVRIAKNFGMTSP